MMFTSTKILWKVYQIWENNRSYDPILWEKAVNRNRHQDDPVLKVNNKNFKTAIVLEFFKKRWT